MFSLSTIVIYLIVGYISSVITWYTLEDCILKYSHLIISLFTMFFAPFVFITSIICLYEKCLRTIWLNNILDALDKPIFKTNKKE